MGVEFRRKAGVIGIGGGNVERQPPLRVVISHLEIAEPSPFYLLAACREIPQSRGTGALHAGAPSLINRLDPFGFGPEGLLRLGNFRGIGRFRIPDGLLARPIRGVPAAGEFAGKLLLPLGEFCRRLLQAAEEFEAPVDAQVEAATHSRS